MATIHYLNQKFMNDCEGTVGNPQAEPTVQGTQGFLDKCQGQDTKNNLAEFLKTQ